MNTLERDIKQFVLKALHRAKDQPINDDTLRSLVRSAFSHVAITEETLSRWISELETSGIITKSEDEVFGSMWSLTMLGITKAQRLK